MKGVLPRVFGPGIWQALSVALSFHIKGIPWDANFSMLTILKNYFR